MRCPYCKSAIVAGSVTCHSCGLSLERVTKLFGVAPTGTGGILDQAEILSAADKRSIRSSANELSIRFPQTYLTIATARLSEGTSLGAFAFWIFNQGGIVREIDRGANNYEILLSIDVAGGRCSLMVGYGLEGLISESALEALIAAAQPLFAEGRFATGIGVVIAGMKSELTHIVSRLEETHGLAPIVHTKSTAEVTSPADF